jgi:hypothetical protein
VAKKKQLSFRVNTPLADRVQVIADKLAQTPWGIAVGDGETTVAAALRYILMRGVPVAEQELGIGQPPEEAYIADPVSVPVPEPVTPTPST